MMVSRPTHVQGLTGSVTIATEPNGMVHVSECVQLKATRRVWVWVWVWGAWCVLGAVPMVLCYHTAGVVLFGGLPNGGK